MKSQFLTRKELAEKLDVTVSVIAQLIHAGMPHHGKLFNIEEVVKWRQTRAKEMLTNLVVGDIYSNKKITDIFLCSTQGGMRRSHRTNTLVLFSDRTGDSVYEDRWIENVLQYTGMGLVGDQVLEGNQNKILANSTSNFVQVHLFETFNTAKHTYTGQVFLSNAPYTEDEKDQNDTIRKVYKFPLTLVNKEKVTNEKIMKKNDKEKKSQIDKLTKKEIELNAKKISQLNKARKEKDPDAKEYRFAKVKQYTRDIFIALYVKELSKGICQLCDKPAPFKKDELPFLHSHHIDFLSNGGSDTIDNSIAVCPNCHSKIHELERVEDKQKLLSIVAKRKEV